MIPFYLPSRTKNQEKYVSDCLREGALSSDGPRAQAVCSLLRDKLGAGRVLLTPSASHALDMIFWNLNPGDEVILPAYNFPSAANSVLRSGAVPVLCDIDPLTNNASIPDIKRRITAKTKAVCVTHYAGVACDMDALAELGKSGVAVVEDAAQAAGASYKGHALGTIGDFACYSFHYTKNITCGEGGAYMQKRGGESFSLAQMVREKGTNRQDFLAGSAARYQWEHTGSSFLLSELCAAMLLAQLEELEDITAARLRVCGLYDRGLERAFTSGRLSQMGITPGALANGHIYYVKLPSPAILKRVQGALGDRGIPALTHFVPLHLGSMGRSLGYRPGDFPESERAYETLLRLPIHTGLTDDQVEYICETLGSLL